MTNQYHYSSWHSKIMSFSAPRCPSHGHRFLCSSIFLISSFCACSLKWKTQDQNWSVDVTQIYFWQIQFHRIPKSKVYYCMQKIFNKSFFFSFWIFLHVEIFNELLVYISPFITSKWQESENFENLLNCHCSSRFSCMN